MKHKILSVVLSVALVISFVPSQALARGTQPSRGVASRTSDTNTSDINSASESPETEKQISLDESNAAQTEQTAAPIEDAKTELRQGKLMLLIDGEEAGTFTFTPTELDDVWTISDDKSKFLAPDISNNGTVNTDLTWSEQSYPWTYKDDCFSFEVTEANASAAATTYYLGWDKQKKTLKATDEKTEITFKEAADSTTDEDPSAEPSTTPSAAPTEKATENEAEVAASLQCSSGVELREGALRMFIDGIDVGVFTFEKTWNGWTICNDEDAYLSFNSWSKEIEESDDAFVWKYEDNTFSYDIYERWGFWPHWSSYYIDAELEATREKTEVTFEEIGIGPISSYAAIVYVESVPYPCKTADEAWAFATRPANFYDDVTIVLNEDWYTTSQLTFAQHSKEATFTLDLNEHSITRLGARYGKKGSVMDLSKAGTFVIENGTITGGMKSGNGGGIFIGGKSNTQVTLRGLSVTDNTCTGNGGGIYCENNGNLSLTLTNVSVSDNTCTVNGGGVYLCSKVSTQKVVAPFILDGSAVINDNYASSAESNLVLELGKNNLIDVASLTSGARIGVNLLNNQLGVFTKGFGSPERANELKGYFVSDNPSATVVASKQSGNPLELASITEQGRASLTIADQTFYYETADAAWTDANNTYRDQVVTMKLYGDWGRASAVQFSNRTAGATLILDLNTFCVKRSLTSAQTTGEVISLCNTGTYVIENGTITGGNKAGSGGGIWIEGIKGTSGITSLTLKNVTISGNSCTQKGGGIYQGSTGNSELILSGVTIKNNSAEVNGGGINFDASNTNKISLKGCTITNNNATQYGAGFFEENITDNASAASFAGKITITGNKLKNGTNSNLVINQRIKSLIDVSGLESGSSIGVSIFDVENIAFTLANIQDSSKANTIKGYFTCETPYSSIAVEQGAGNPLRFSVDTNQTQASLTVNGIERFYATAVEAWRLANSTYLNTTVEVKLYKDWVATRDGFGTGVGFGMRQDLYPGRKADGTELILNLNSKTINRNLFHSTKNYYVMQDGRILHLGQPIKMTIKNGTMTGGCCAGEGGCIWMDNDNPTLILDGVTIKYNMSMDDNGGGINLEKGNLTIKDCWISDNEAKGEPFNWAHGGGVYMKGGSLLLKGKVIINWNHQRGFGSGDDLYIWGYNYLKNPELTEGSYIRLRLQKNGRLTEPAPKDSVSTLGFHADERRTSVYKKIEGDKAWLMCTK